MRSYKRVGVGFMAALLLLTPGPARGRARAALHAGLGPGLTRRQKEKRRQQPPKKGDAAQQIDDYLLAEADYQPCRDVVFSDKVRELEKNVVVYLEFEGDAISAAKIRPTCDYSEPSLPPRSEYNLMSEATYRRLLGELEVLKPLGPYAGENDLSVVLDPLVKQESLYSDAVIERYVYGCEESSASFGCGVNKFDVFYFRPAQGRVEKRVVLDGAQGKEYFIFVGGRKLSVSKSDFKKVRAGHLSKFAVAGGRLAKVL